MPTRKKKSSNRSVRKTSRGHQQSTSGKISPPLDVRSPTDLASFKKRIMDGPITIVMVYADWCGHCHEMRPHFDAAAKSPNRTIQAVSVNEKMLDRVNQSINESINNNAKPIEVEGYPSILLVDQQGNKVSDVNAVKDTSVMTKVMSTSTVPNNEAEEAEEAENDSFIGSNGSLANSVNKMNSYVGEDRLKGSIASSINSKGNIKNLSKNAIKPVTPSETTGDRITAPVKGVVGGSLFGAISQTAYTLAPAAILLATAATMMNKRKSHKKRHGKKKGTLKRKHRSQRK